MNPIIYCSIMECTRETNYIPLIITLVCAIILYAIYAHLNEDDE